MLFATANLLVTIFVSIDLTGHDGKMQKTLLYFADFCAMWPSKTRLECEEVGAQQGTRTLLVAMTEVTFVYLIFGRNRENSAGVTVTPTRQRLFGSFKHTTSDVFCAITKHSISGLFLDLREKQAGTEKGSEPQ